MWCLVARTLLLLLGLLPAAAGYTCFPPRCCSRSCAARARPLLLQQRGVPEGGDATLDVQDLKEKPFYSWPMTPGYNAKLALLYTFLSIVVSLFAARLRFGRTFVSTRLRNRVNYFEDQQA